MIEPMKRVVVVASAAEREPMLEELRTIGVLHLQPAGAPAMQGMESLGEPIRVLESALELVANTPPHATAAASDPAGTMAARGLEAARSLLDSTAELELTKQELAKLTRTRAAQQALGHFDPREIIALRQHDIFVRLYECSPRKFAKLLPSGTVHRVAERGGMVVLAQVAGHSATRLSLRELELPETSLTEIENQLARCEMKITGLIERLDTLRQQSATMRGSLRFYRNALAFEQALAGMGGDQRVCSVQGFCPAGRVAEIAAMASRHGWAILTEDPGVDDPAPTLLHQSRCGAWFQPVMTFIGVTPGYREFDANGVVLVFFSLFVAMIIGDAGYGVLMLIATLGAARQRSVAVRHLLPLLSILSAATIVWGALTGMWFGIHSWAELPVLRSFVLPSLNAFNDDSRPLLRFCLLLGAVHLSVAHGWAALRRGSLQGLGELGWALIVWGVYFVAAWLLLGESHPGAIRALLPTGGMMVLLCCEQDGTGFLRGVRNGLLNLPLNLLNATGSFSDLISYIRLFAVGLATKEVAVTFNEMAAQVGAAGGVAVLGAVFIATIGHTLNLSLAVLGVLVHGARLNLLEFSRHLNVSWSGIPYQPFRWLTEEVATMEQTLNRSTT